MKFVSFVSYRYHSVAYFRPLNLPVNFIFHNIIMHWMEWSIFCQHQSAMDDLSEKSRSCRGVPLNARSLSLSQGFIRSTEPRHFTSSCFKTCHLFNLLTSYRFVENSENETLHSERCQVSLQRIREEADRIDKILIWIDMNWYDIEKIREDLNGCGYAATLQVDQVKIENQVDLLPWNDLLHFHGKDIFTTNNNHVLQPSCLNTWEHTRRGWRTCWVSWNRSLDRPLMYSCSFSFL